MRYDVDIEEMKKDAVEIFQQGFACSEAVIYAIKKGFDLDLSDDAIAMSSGFPWGLGEEDAFVVLWPAERCVSVISLEEESREILHLPNVRK